MYKTFQTMAEIGEPLFRGEHEESIRPPLPTSQKRHLP